MWHRRSRSAAPAVALGIVVGLGVGTARAEEHKNKPSYEQLMKENKELRAQLEEGGDGAALGEDASFSGGIDFSSFYLFRGIPQQNEGVIAQPWAEVGFTLYESETGPINSISASAGTWNSLHGSAGDVPGGASETDIWYEMDLYAGMSMALYDDWTLSVTHTTLTSPNDSFNTIHEVAGTVSYDDSDLLGDWAMSPYVTVIGEYDGVADSGADRGIYVEVGGGPSFTVIDSQDYPVTMSVPLTLGLNGGDYYQDGMGNDDTFGYFDIGADFSMPLAFMGERWGNWTANAGVHYITLGDSTAQIGQNFGVTSGDDNFVYGSIGVSVSF